MQEASIVIEKQVSKIQIAPTFLLTNQEFQELCQELKIRPGILIAMTYGEGYLPKNSEGEGVVSFTAHRIEPRKLKEGISQGRTTEESALYATSVGPWQIGAWSGQYEAMGYRSVQEFWNASRTVEGQIGLLERFLKMPDKAPLLRALQQGGVAMPMYEAIAAGHNGAKWREHNPHYATRLQKYHTQVEKAILEFEEKFRGNTLAYLSQKYSERQAQREVFLENVLGASHLLEKESWGIAAKDKKGNVVAGFVNRDATPSFLSSSGVTIAVGGYFFKNANEAPPYDLYPDTPYGREMIFAAKREGKIFTGST